MIDIVWTNWPITWGLLAATLLVQTAIPAKDIEADLRSLAPHACGIAAAKVKAIRTVDLRGGDGPLVREFTLDVIRATGRVPEIIVRYMTRRSW